MSDFLGPADAPNSVTVRPTEARTFGNADSWFKDCTSPVLEDGTDIQANWLNGIIAALRSIWRVNGKLADNVTDVNPEVGTDDGGLAKALLHLIQRAQQSYAVDTGVANAIAVSFTPAPPELKAGMHFRVKVKVANTGATTVEVNGGPAIALKHPNGAAMAAGDLLANGIAVIVYDGTVFQLIASHTDQTGGGGGGGTTFRVPIANAGGTATAITATYTPTTASPVAGDLFSVKLTSDIAGATTFEPDGHGPFALKNSQGGALVAGDALNGDLILMEYDGTNFRIISRTSKAVSPYVFTPAIGSYAFMAAGSVWPYGNPYPGYSGGPLGAAFTNYPGTWLAVSVGQQTLLTGETIWCALYQRIA